jgi:hypothetical protein
LIWTRLLATPSGGSIDIAARGGCASVDAWLAPSERTTLDGRSLSPGWNLARFDAEGALEWIRSLVPSASTNNFGVGETDRLPDGGVVVGGQFTSPVDFGNGVPFEGGPSLDGFLARYDGAGKLIKVSRFENHPVSRLVTNGLGDVLLHMLGYDDTIDFGLGPTVVSDYVELAADGQYRWSVPRVGSLTLETANGSDGFALGPGGEAVVSGTRWEPIPDDDFETVEVVVSYDGSGKAVREQTFRGASAAALALQPNGDTVLLPGAGFRSPSTPPDFGCGASPAAASLVVVALRRDGTCHWMHAFSGTSRAQLATDGFGGVLVAGETNDQIVTDLATGAAQGANGKFFLLRLDESGQLVWGRTLGEAAVGFVTGLGKIAFDSSGVWLAGYFSAPIDFGAGALVPVGPADGFLLRLAP